MQHTVDSLVSLFTAQPNRGCPRAWGEKVRLLTHFSAHQAGEPAERIGDKPVGSLLPADLHFWLSGNPKWQSDWTRRRIMAAVRHPFTWAARLRVIDRDPFLGMRHPIGRRGRPMTDEEFLLVLQASDQYFRWLLWFMRYTGARTGEAACLEWDMVQLDRGVCVIEDHKTAHIIDKPRIIVLPQAAVGMLKLLRESNCFDPKWVFINSRGTPWSRYTLATKFKRLRAKLGFSSRCRLYGLRHRYGTAAVKRGLDLKTIAELMGHASTRTTEYYVHIAGEIEHLRSAAELIAQ